MDNTESNYWLENASASKAILHMALPMMLGMAASMIYNLTDTFFVGQLKSTSAMAAVTLAMPLTTIMMAIGHLFGIGGGTRISRMIGEKKSDMAKNTSVFAIWSAVITGLLFMLICIPNIQWILSVLGTADGELSATRNYIFPYLCMAPFVIVNFTLEEILRSEGASKESMIGTIISVVVNIILDPVFIFGLHLGIGGAAIATVIGISCAIIYDCSYIVRKSDNLSISLKNLRFEKTTVISVVSIGFSAMLLDLFLVVSALLFNRYAMIYGDYVVAGFGISQRIVQIIELVSMGLYMGIIPLVAAAYSARNNRRLNEIIKKTILYLIGFIGIMSIIVFLLRKQTVSIFTSDMEVVKIGIYTLSVQLLSTFFAAGSGLLMSIFQAMERGVSATIMSVARGVILIPALFLMNCWLGVHGVILSLAVSEMIAFIIGVMVFFVGKNRMDIMPCLR